MTRIGMLVSRGYTNRERIHWVLDAISRKHPHGVIVTGDGREERLLARDACGLGLLVQVVATRWDRDGRGAAYRRNERLLEQVDAVAVFVGAVPDAAADLARKAAARGLTVRAYDGRPVNYDKQLPAPAEPTPAQRELTRARMERELADAREQARREAFVPTRPVTYWDAVHGVWLQCREESRPRYRPYWAHELGDVAELHRS
jgi:hypothetical protein